MHLKSLNADNVKSSMKFLVVMPWALVGRLWGRNIWIITERSDQARDNGYCFFKYVCERHPEQKIIYIIDKSAADYEKIRKMGAVVQFDSWAHYYFYCLSRIHISAHVNGCRPSNSPIARRLKRILSIWDVFLPHGVSYGVSEFCLQKYAKIDLFICSGLPEYKNVLNNYGYTEREVAYTGFPRLDFWHDVRVNKQLILLMPTWRLYIAQNPEVDFCSTVFYKAYQSLINDAVLIKHLEENGLEMIFYLHHEMQKYAEHFTTSSPNIRIVQTSDRYDIQELLKAAALLVTDYSSVHFDFAYMGKPVLYYQFDRSEFFSRQYQRGDFDVERDGFGPVAFNLEELIENLYSMAKKELKMDDVYYARMREFYQIYDMNNCERVYQEIKQRICK
jgi:hypothetical protein